MDVTKLFNHYTRYYHNILLNNAEAESYLYNRGLTSDTIGQFFLGYCDSSFYNKFPGYKNLNIKLYSNFTEREKFDGYILIPIIEEKNVVYFTSRALGQTKLAHLHLNGHSPCPFNANTIGTQDTLYITESPIDAMIMTQAGFSCIAIFTSSSIKADFIKKLINFCGRIVLLFDNDKNLAGQKGSYRCADELKVAGINSHIATLPFLGEGKKTDINMLYLYDTSNFKSMIETATKESISYETTSYYLEQEKKRRDAKQRAELSKETSKIVQDIKQIPITQIVGRFIKFDRTGFGGIAHCPFHPDDKTKSLLMYNNSNLCICMSGACDFQRGDAIQFVRRYFDLGFKEAIKKIQES